MLVRSAPDGTHVQQVYEEIIGQRARTIGEDAVFGPVKVGAQRTHATNKNRQFRCCKPHELRFVEQQFFS